MIALSIIVPVYNVAKYLPACLESLFKQAGFSFEVILVDDASTDDSAEICAQWATVHSEIRLIRHEYNSGLSAARNTGLAHATGTYVTFVDSDDFVEENTLSANMRILLNQPEIDVLEYPVAVHHGSAQATEYQPRKGKEKESFVDWLSRDGYIHSYAWNKIYRRQLWEGFAFPEGRYFEDMFVVPYVLQRSKVIYASTHGMYYYCSRPGSITTEYNAKKMKDLLEANLNLYLQMSEVKQLPHEVLDRMYLCLCDRQIGSLRRGGELVLPERKLSFHSLLTAPLHTSRIKALLLALFGRKSCYLFVNPCKWFCL